MEYFSAAQPVDAPADRVWDILADLGNREFVKGFCRAVHVTGNGFGAVRTFELFDEAGGGSVSERIEQFDPESRCYKYRVFDIGPLPFADYVGSFRIAAAGPERCVVIGHVHHDRRHAGHHLGLTAQHRAQLLCQRPGRRDHWRSIDVG